MGRRICLHIATRTARLLPSCENRGIILGARHIYSGVGREEVGRAEVDLVNFDRPKCNQYRFQSLSIRRLT
jgi:hypothetical protein